MVKPTPNPPGSEQSPPHQSSASEDLNEGDDLELDQNNFEFKSTPRTPCSMYTVNPDIDVQTLLGCVSESLASASVITMDIADRESGPSRNSLLGIHQIIMLAEISVNRALDQLDPIE